MSAQLRTVRVKLPIHAKKPHWSMSSPNSSMICLFNQNLNGQEFIPCLPSPSPSSSSIHLLPSSSSSLLISISLSLTSFIIEGSREDSDGRDPERIPVQPQTSRVKKEYGWIMDGSVNLFHMHNPHTCSSMARACYPCMY